MYKAHVVSTVQGASRSQHRAQDHGHLLAQDIGLEFSLENAEDLKESGT